MEQFLRRLGYRLVIRSVAHATKARAGAETEVKIAWENVGVAPPYRDYRVALRLRAGDTTSAKPFVAATDTSIRGWLPGKQTTDLTFKVPDSLGVGRYELAVGVVDPETREPAVKLAITGRDPAGWYPVSKLEVVR